MFPFTATMETELLQSTSLRSGTKAYHHAQNMLRIALLCQAQLVPFVLKKRSKKKQKKGGTTWLHARALLRHKKPPHLTLLMTDLMLFKKWDHLSLLKTKCAWRGPEVRPGRGEEKKEKNTSSPPPLHPHTENKSCTHPPLPFRNKWSYQSIPRSHGEREERARGTRRAKLRRPKTLREYKLIVLRKSPEAQQQTADSVYT